MADPQGGAIAQRMRALHRRCLALRVDLADLVRDVERAEVEIGPLVFHGDRHRLHHGRDVLERARQGVAQTGEGFELVAEFMEQLHGLPPQDGRAATPPPARTPRRRRS